MREATDDSRVGAATVLRLRVRLTAVSLMAVAVAFVHPGRAAAAPGEEVTFVGDGGTVLHGTVITPEGAAPQGGFPAVVMVHGSGPGPRERIRPLAELFAGVGIVTLIYDKRTEGYSQGERDYSVLANDALAAAGVLKTQKSVDPARVGLFGVSEGGWVAPLAASRSAEIGFLITVAANSVSPARQEQWHRANRLDHAGVRGSLLRSYSETFWRQFIGNGLFPEAHYDPIPALEKVRQPVLALWGEHDRLTPPAESLTAFKEVFDRVGHTHYTLRVLPGADHVLRQTPDRGFTRGDTWVAGYPELVASWVNALKNGPPVASADAPPRQDRSTVAITPLSWYESGWVQVAAVLFFLAVFASYPLVGLLRRLRRVPRTASIRPARWLVITGALTSLSLIVYFLFLTATAALRPGPVLVGRPLPWLLLQTLAVTAAVSLVLTIRTWQRRPDGERVRLAVLSAGGTVFVLWALYWGLLLP